MVTGSLIQGKINQVSSPFYIWQHRREASVATYRRHLGSGDIEMSPQVLPWRQKVSESIKGCRHFVSPVAIWRKRWRLWWYMNLRRPNRLSPLVSPWQMATMEVATPCHIRFFSGYQYMSLATIYIILLPNLRHTPYLKSTKFLQI